MKVGVFRALVMGLWVVGQALVGPAAFAQSYPTRPIRMIIPYGVGGNADVVARLISPRISTIVGQPVVIENRGGAAGIPGMEGVARAAPDGYTLLFAASNLTSNPILFRTLPYDTRTDFAPISLVAIVPTVLVVPLQSPIKSVQDLIDAARANPGALDYGSVGYGSGNHLTTEVFANAAGLVLQHVPYRSASAMLTDLLGDRLSFVFSTIPSAHSQIAGGRLRPVAVSSRERSLAMPQVPTVSESGVPGFDVNTWLGILAPAGTSPEIVRQLNAATVQVLQNPEVREQLKALGADPAGGTPERFAEHLDIELNRWSRLAETVKFELN
jgi:tripartite-type tricarboxylate transporter receptor subunit TctC